MSNFKIPIISKKEFVERIKKKDLENFEPVKLIEDFFFNKRKYIFKMPAPGSPVVLLVSGGIESTITWGLLLEKYGLNVYPLFLHRGLYRKKREQEAVNYFSKYFKKKYPKLFHYPQTYSTHLPPPEIEKAYGNRYKFFHPLRILDQYDPKTNISRIMHSRGILPFSFSFYGVAYANYLWDHKNLKVNTIFNGVAPGDGDFVACQTFSALRTILFSVCIATDNYTWQIASLAFEKEIGHWLEKHDLIRLGAKMKIPLERTWSCYNARKYQCGDQCLTCQYRRIAFNKAKVLDKTHYEVDDFWGKLIRKSKNNLHLVLDKIISFV